MLIFTSFLSYQYLPENRLSLKFVKIPMGSGQEAYQVIPCEGKWMQIWYKCNINNGNDLYKDYCDEWDGSNVRQ